jgi:hypothetical protein
MDGIGDRMRDIAVELTIPAARYHATRASHKSENNHLAKLKFWCGKWIERVDCKISVGPYSGTIFRLVSSTSKRHGLPISYIVFRSTLGI